MQNTIRKYTDKCKDFTKPFREPANRGRAAALALFLLLLAAMAFYGSFPMFFYNDGILLRKKALLFAVSLLWACLVIGGKSLSDLWRLCTGGTCHGGAGDSAGMGRETEVLTNLRVAVNALLLLLIPLLSFGLAEYVMGISEPWKMDFKFVFLNIVLYAILMYGVFVLTFSVGVAMDVVCTLAFLFGVTNVYLVRFRQIPLMVSDFSVAKTAANVAEGFSYEPTMPMLLGGIILADIWLLSFVLRRNKCLAKSLSLRLPMVAVYVAGVCLFVFLSFRNDADFLRTHASINTFRPIKSYRKHGGMLTLYSSVRLMLVKKPDGYSGEAVEKIAQNYTSDSRDQVAKEDLPNVIVILDEAFNHLDTLGDLQTNQEVTPFFDSLEKKKNAFTGTAYVSVFGGQTANTEFEFLTGDSKAFLPRGSTPYQLYIRDYVPSLTGEMKNLGARGMLALHPFAASGYNRIAVYNNLGFSRFISDVDFPKDVTLVRDLISDQEDFDRIIEEYEKSEKEDKDAPFYLFNVTMQSHSPYDRVWNNLDKAIKIQNPKLRDVEAEQYLDCMKVSDGAFQNLVDYFSKTDDKTIICFWGDHMPGLSDGFYEKLMGKSPDKLSDEEAMSLYTVPFVVWANYDIDDTPLKTPISMSYLKALMLKRSGMPMSGYDKFLLDLMEDVPAINGHGYFGADGRFYELEDEKSPYAKRLREYAMLNYNHLFDKKHRSEMFELK